MNKKLLIMCLIIAFFVSISSVSAIDAQQSDNLTLLSQESPVISITSDCIKTSENITLSGDNAVLGVSNSDDDILSAGTKNQLSNLISGASSNSTLYLPDDYIFTAGYASSSGISINYKNNLVIDGQGHTIDANGLGRIFQVGSSSSNITFKNIIFKNANYDYGNGGAIYFTGTNLNVINCTFDSNVATSSSSKGGSIYTPHVEGSVINIVNSTFTKSTAVNGGALYFDNPNQIQHPYYVNIEGCNFTDNSIIANSNTLGGGAIYIHRSVETTIKSSVFSRNTAIGKDGGAIRYSGSTRISDCEFYDNKATHGGALCFGQAVDLIVENTIFVNNSALDQGGSIKARFIEANNITIINSTAVSGGAIFSRSGTASIQNSKITNASATQGGSIFVHPDISTVLISNVDMSNTHAVEGGAIYSNAGGTMNIVDSSINNASANYGGAVYINQGKATISGSNIENSTASLQGGAVYVKTNNVEIKDSFIKNNTAPIGGAVYWNGNNGKISGTDFVDNDGVNGSSIYWAGDNGIVEKSTFNDNNITTGSIHWHGSNGQIVDNTLLTDKGIYLCEHSSDVTLKQNTELAPSGGNYSVYIGNTTTATLIGNDFNNLIENHGKILSPVYITTLNNITVISNKDSMIIYTSVVDDNGNYLDITKNLVNVYDNENLTTTYNGTHFVSTVHNIKIGEHRVYAVGYDSNTFANLTIKSGGILYLLLNLTVNQTNYGETVTITLNIVNTTYNDTVDIALNDVHYNATLINGTAVLVLHNLAPNTYEIVASFMEYNQTLSTDVEIKVVLRNSTINVTATNVYYGNITTITVNVTNGTTGNVFLFVNNKMYTIKLVNSTGQYNLTGLAGGNYTVFAFYNGDVLFDSSYNQTSFTVYKYNTPINITVNDIYVGQIANIKVDFPSDINGRMYIYVNDEEYVYYNRTSITLYESDLPAGNITVRVYHDGNEKYYANNTVTYFNVTKKNMTITIQTADIVVGENATVSVIIPADAKGHVTLNVNGTQYYEYANSTVAKFVISGLSRGTYNITATYQEGPVYNTANATSSFNVNYVRAYEFNVSASSDNDLNVYVDISLPSDIDGDVYVNINGTNYTASMSKGKDVVIIPGLLSGRYEGTVYLVNDSKYLSSNRTFTVNLNRNAPTINVDYNSTIYVDDDAIIKVTVDSDATGNITITINNTNYTKKIENAAATFNITGLVWNNYRFNLTYSGDRKYSSDTKNYPLNVIRITNYYAKLSAPDIYVGDNAIIYVNIEEDATGNITVIINGSTHTFKVENGYGSISIPGLLSGNHIIDATYKGDNKYEPRHGVFEDFHVRKISNYEFTPSGETNQSNANITVDLPDDATGSVNITVNGVTYPNIAIENGQANLTVHGLEPGMEYPVKVDYTGNEKYVPISKNITLNSHKTLNYNFTVEGDTIYVGEVAYVRVYLPEADANDKVRLTLGNNTPIEVSVGNGTIIRAVPNLAEGNYLVLVEYLGNDRFEASSKYTDIFVAKISLYKFDISTNEPSVGENLTIDVTLPDDAKGNITININKINYTSNITNGTAHFDIPNLAFGNYNFTASYTGDNKYYNSFRTGEAFVKKVYPYEFVVTPQDIYVGQNETIKIVLPKDLNGSVTITISNTDYINRVIDVVNGTGWFNVTGLKEGQYSLSVSLKDDAKYRESSVSSKFKVSPIQDYLFNVTVSNPNYVRDNITFTVQLPKNATGNVSVIIFGREYQGTVNNGVAIVNITAPYYGTFPYRVSFEEKGKYTLKTSAGSVVISKLDVNLNPEFKSPVHVGENVTIHVQLPKDATGNITFITRMLSYTAKLVNGYANLTIEGYPLAQSYSPSISYSGDDRYNANSTVVHLDVIKVSDYNITVNVSDINVGDVEVVNITIPADATEDVLIYGNFSERRYSQSLKDGKTTFSIPNLPAGTYNITVLYQGFNKYENKNVTKTFTVSKVNSTIAIELVDRTIVVSVPADATGNVTISIAGIKENVTVVNGKAILDISSLHPDEYVVTASYAGDGKYLENATDKLVNLPQITDYLINVTVSNIIVGEKATVIINLPSDANGYANVTINTDEFKNIEVKNGIAKFDVSKLPVGNYNVKVNFTDKKYAFNNNSTTFKVNQIKTVLTPVTTVDGRNITVVVGITENATGNITIYVDNVPYSREINDNKATLTLNNLMPGDHIIRASYNGDINHTSANTPLYGVTIDKISDYSLIIDLTRVITVVENNIVTVTFPDEAYGRVTINYNDEYINAEIDTTTHTATAILPLLKEGEYTVYVSYSDALYDYVENSTIFTVIKLNTTVDVDVENIIKDQSEIINITLHENATGDLFINVNGTVYHVTLDKNGKANLTLTNLDDGNYTVVVNYYGDDFFNVNSTSVNFTVSKIPVDITINASDIIVGHVLNIKFNMSREVTDLVTVQVGTTNYTTFAYKGNGSLDVHNLPAGDYDIIVYYTGSTDYLPTSNKTAISVNGKKTTSIDVRVADITVGENITVYVNTTDAINSTVYVTIGGLAYTRDLVNGKVNFTVSGLIARDYTVSAFFMGNDEFELCNDTSYFTVHKRNTPLDLVISDIDISQLINVSVKVPKQATGYVLININGTEFYSNIVNGTANYTIPPTKTGYFVINVTYLGDDNYLRNITNGSFNVFKIVTGINIIGKDIFVGQNVTFNITLGADITEVIIINVASESDKIGKNYTTFVENGNGTYTVFDLPEGEYNVTVYFPGNTIYAAVNNTTIIKVSSKKSSQITVKVSNITVDENAIIYVNVTPGTTGDVTVVIAGNTYTKSLNNSKANFTISGLIARDYHVTAYYLGDDYYLTSNSSAEFTVNKKVTSINATAGDIHVGQSTIINVNVTAGATGVVLIDINGTRYYANITNSKACISIPNLAVGKYNVTVTYVGDDKFHSNETETNFTVSKLTPAFFINLPAGDKYAYGDVVIIHLTGPENVTGVVSVKVVTGSYTQTYTAYIHNGEGNLTIVKIDAGSYNVSAVYQENYMYYSNISNNLTFEVYSSEGTLDVHTEKINVGETENISVFLRGNHTGNVTVYIDGNPTNITFVYNEGTNTSTATLQLSDLVSGVYNVKAVYVENVDGKEVIYEGTSVFTVSKIDSTITIKPINNIKVGENVTIEFNVLPQGVNGTIDVYVGGKHYSVNVTNPKLTLSGLGEGIVPVRAVYNGDNKYLSSTNESDFIVYKNDVRPEISVSDIKINETVNITVTLPKDAKGYVLININGTHFYSDVINGSAKFIIPPTKAGTFAVNATYLGDDKYYTNSTTDSYVVSKLKTDIIVKGSDISFGSDEELIITTSQNLTEVVVIEIDGKNYTSFIKEGEGNFTVRDLTVGSHTVYVYFEGNLRYDSAQNYTVFNVESKDKSDITIDVNSIIIGDDVVIYTNVTPGATGIVTIVVAGDTYTKQITTDKVNFTLSGLSARDYHVTAYYFGDDKYMPSNTTSEFTVYKKNADLGHSVTNSTVGSVEFINITLPKDAKGYVLLNADGAHYYADIIDGVAQFNVTGLLVGEHDVNVTYMGDDTYNISSTSFKVNISKISTLIDIVGENIIVGKGVTLIIKTSENITDLATVNVGNKNYTVFIHDGEGNLTVYDLIVSIYTATVYYNGNDVYNAAQNKTSFTVSNKKVSNVDISVNNIFVGQDEIITVRVTPGATGDVTIVIRGKKYVETLNNGVARFTISDLAARDYEVSAIYHGDENYLASQNTAKFTVSKLNLDVIVTAQNITAGSTENIEINLSEKESGIVLVNVGSDGYYVNVTDGNGVLKLNHLNAGNYDVSVIFLGDDKYNSQSNITSFTVKPITDEDIKINVDHENKTVIIEVPGNQTGNVTVVIDGKNVTGEVINNTIVVNITDLLPGNHTIEVIYKDKNYTVYDNTTDIVIPKVKDYPFDVSVTVDGNNAEISVELPEGINGVVLVDVDGKGYYMNVTNGTGKLLLTDLNKGTYDVSLKYPGDEKYEEAENSTSFTIESGRVDSMDIRVGDINVGDNLTVDVVVPSDAKGNVVVEIDGKTYISPINNGIAKFNIPCLNEGNYTIKATYSGDDKYPSESASTEVQVSKVKDYPMNVTVDGKDITVNLPDDAEGNVTVIIDGRNYTAKVENGTAVIHDPELKPGKHNITVIYGDEKYSPEENSSVIDVANKLFINAPAVVKYYSGSERFFVYLEDMNGKKIANADIVITVNGVSYSRTTNENGTASIAINLNSGEYPVTVIFKGNSEFNQTSVSSNITVNPTIYANDVFKVFRNGTHYYALFTDAQGNPLANTEVSFNIHGVFYTRTTNATGWAKLNINLEKGEYILTAINPVTHEMRTNNVTVISLIVENYDITKYFRNGTQFVARIVAADGSYAGAGEKVTFNINGVFYTRATDENGYVKLNINIEPGEYIITTYYKDCRESNTIKVLPILLADDLEMRYRDGSQFVVHLLDGQGNPYPNQIINFNIHGIIYNRLTDSNGDAKLNINLQSGEYLVTSTYGAAKLSNKITIV